MTDHQDQETRLHRPGTQLLMAGGALFGIVGFALMPFALEGLADLPKEVDLFSKVGFEENGGVLIMTILSFAFAFAGSALVLVGLRQLWMPVLIQHAMDTAAPGVPARALLDADAATQSYLTHHLVGDRLEMNPTPRNRQRLFLWTFCVGFAALVFALFLGLRPLDAMFADASSSTTTHVLLGCAATGALLGVAAVIDYFLRRGVASLVTFDFAGGQFEVRIESSDKTLAAGGREQIVAVQTVAAVTKITNKGSTTRAPALEINLAWRDGEQAVRRVNLVRCSGSLPATARLGSALAARLRVPYLFQAGDDDFRDSSRRRSRRRR